MDSLFSFPVGLFHSLQHAGLSRRTLDDALSVTYFFFECSAGPSKKFKAGSVLRVLIALQDYATAPLPAVFSATISRVRGGRTTHR